MTFFEHTERWFKGEAFEAWMLVLFGSGLVVLALYFWKFGHGPTARVMILPFLVVGLLAAVGAGVGLVKNTSRLEAFRAEHDNAPTKFIQSEKERVEGFMNWYKPLLISWSVLILIGLGLFHLWGGNLGRAIGLAVILLGVTGLMVDHTSEHNARAYRAEITKVLKS